jgi:PAS domain-containing protein
MRWDVDCRPRRTRKQIEEELRKAEETFSRAFRQSPMALMLTSAKDSRFIEVNDTFERITGWRRDDVIGRTPDDIGLWAEPDQRAHVAQRLLSGDEWTFRVVNGSAALPKAASEIAVAAALVAGTGCVTWLVWRLKGRRATEISL